MRHILPQLHYFSVVAKTLSFTRSAKELNISQSAVSYQIKKLEEQIGALLLVRDTRNRTRLTPAGERLASCCQEIFDRLDSALDSIDGRSSEGALTVTSATCLGSLFLSSAIKGLRDRHPGLKVKLHLSEPVVDMMEGSVDLAIRSSIADKRLDYQYLFKARMVLAATTEYLDQSPAIKKIADLREHCLVQLSPDDYDWLELRRDRPEIELPELHNVVYIDNQIGISQAIRSGVGIAYLPAYTISRELHEGTIRELPLSEFHDIHIPYYAACAPALAGNERIRTFVHYLTEFLIQPQYQGAFVMG
jgi:DNA-binding transcriptional LysR family regulator